MPESLVAALDELDRRLRAARRPTRRSTPSSTELHRSYTGRPSIITEVPRFAEHAGGARIILKREDLNHTGSHKINNVLGQALLTKRIGKTRVIAETGAGQHGVATATAAALFGLECTIYMGEVDTERQALNVARMRLLGAEVVAVKTGSRTLKDAINEAMRDWVTNVETPTTSSAPSPGRIRSRPWSATSRRSSARRPARRCSSSTGRLPDAVAACVGGGSNAIGIFHAFLDDPEVAPVRLRGGRRGRRHRAARRDHHQGPARRAARRPQLPAAGRGRPDHRVALDLRRPRLPGRRPGARLAARHRPGQLPAGHRRRRHGARCACCQPHRGHHPRDRVGARPRRRAASSAASSARTRSSW